MQRELSRAGGKFYFAAVLTCALIIFFGFAPSFYLKGVFDAPPPLTALTVMHGIVFTAWVLLFVVQAGLIANGKPALHRQLGVLGAILFGVVITLGFSTAITAARLGHAPPGSPAPMAFLVLPLSAIIGAAVLVVLALANRARSDFHKRLMLAAIIIMTPPAMHRLLIIAGQAQAATVLVLILADLMLVAAAAYDFVQVKRLHPAYVWSVAVFAVIDVAVWWGFTSPQWLPIAEWITHGS